MLFHGSSLMTRVLESDDNPHRRPTDSLWPDKMEPCRIATTVAILKSTRLRTGRYCNWCGTGEMCSMLIPSDTRHQHSEDCNRVIGIRFVKFVYELHLELTIDTRSRNRCLAIPRRFVMPIFRTICTIQFGGASQKLH